MLFYSNLIEGCVSSFIITFSTTMGATKESNYGFGTLLLHNKSAANSAGEQPGVYGTRSMTRFYIIAIIVVIIIIFCGEEKRCAAACASWHFGSPVP